LVDGFDGLQRVSMQDGGVVQIDDPGTQTVYAERYTSDSGTSFNSGTNTFSGTGPAITVRITGPDNQPVDFQPLSGSETYVYNHREGVRIGQFTAPTAGNYRIAPVGEPNGYDYLSVGSGLKIEGIGVILGGVFGGGLVVLIGIILVIVFAVRRSRSKKRLTQGSAPYPSPYGAAGGWPAAPGGAGPGGYAAPGAAPGYGAPGAPGGFGPGAPGAPAPGAWPPAPGANPGWVPPPVAQPGPTWTPPVAPPPQDQPAPGTPWQPPAPEAPEPWQPPGGPSQAPPAEAPSEAPPADAPTESTTWNPPPPPSPPPAPPAGEGDAGS
jgi:hypothetical protein